MQNMAKIRLPIIILLVFSLGTCFLVNVLLKPSPHPTFEKSAVKTTHERKPAEKTTLSPTAPVNNINNKTGIQTIAPLHPTGKIIWFERFSDAEVLEERSTAPDKEGHYIQEQFIKTDFKYPYIRIVNHWIRNPVDGSLNLEQTQAMVANHLIIKKRDGLSQIEYTNLLTQIGGSPEDSLYGSDAQIVAFGDPNIDTISNAMHLLGKFADAIEYAEPNYLVHTMLEPNDPNYDNNSQWGLLEIQAAEGWDIRTSASNIVVAIIDTGVRYTHQDLADNIWHNPGEIPGNGLDDDSNGFVDDTIGYDFSNRDIDPADDGGHGTSMAGIVGAKGNNQLLMTGVAWDVQLMVVKFLNDEGYGTTADAVSSINYAVAEGASVLNASWGGTSYSIELRETLINARNHGVVMIASAGNDAADNDRVPNYPSGYTLDNIVSVGAMDWDGRRASFSNWGRDSVDLFSPGRNLSSLSHESDTSYRYTSGTSPAAAYISGICALLKVEFPEENYSSLIGKLLAGTVYSENFDGLCVTHGKANLYRALAEIGPEPISIIVDPESIDIFSGQTLRLNVEFSGFGPYSFQWYHNDVPIPSQTHQELKIDNISTAKTGIYYVRITNPVGTVESASATVTVSDSPPFIIRHPEDTTAVIGQRVVLKVEAGGSLPMTFRWTLEGEDIPNSNSPTLVLNSVDSDDAGQYRVHISNVYGNSSSRIATLELRENVVDEWVFRNPYPSNSTYYKVIYANNRYVAVGSKGAVITSDDGFTWHLSNPVTDNDLWDVTYGEGIFLAVGDNGTILESPDGLNWDQQPAATSKHLTQVEYGNGLFVILGQGEGTTAGLTSDSSMQWQVYTSGILNGTLTYGNGIFLASDHSSLFTSTDGLEWTENDGLSFDEATYGDGRFWTQFNGKLAFSVDGENWTVSEESTPSGNHFIYHEGKIYLIKRYSSSALIRVIDPSTNVNNVLYEIDQGTLFSITAANGTLVGVGTFIVASSDFSTFELLSHRISASLNGIAYGNGLYVAVGEDADIYTSTDGKNWFRRPVKWYSHPDINDIAYGNGRFIAVGDEASWASTDGINWTNSKPFWAVRIFYAGDRFWAFYNDYGTTLYTFSSTKDGIDWDTETIDFAGGIVFNSGRYVALGSDGYIRTSNDGETWAEQEQLGSYTSRPSLVSGNGEMLATTTGNDSFFRSTDGINWNEVEITGKDELGHLRLMYVDGIYLESTGHELYKSLNGQDWVRTLNSRIEAVASGPDGVIAVGGNTILEAIKNDDEYPAVPTITIELPEALILNQPYTLTAEVEGDGNEITRVEFFAGGDLAGSSENPPYTITWRPRKLGEHALVAVTENDSGRKNYSESKIVRVALDGWQQVAEELGDFQTIGPMAAHENIVIIVLDDNKLMRSASAGSWDNVNISALQSSEDIEELTHLNNVFLLSTSQGRIFTSNNGLAWIERTSPISQPVSFNYANGQFVGTAVNTMIVSNDGKNWYLLGTADLRINREIIYFDDKYIAREWGYLDKVYGSSNLLDWELLNDEHNEFSELSVVDGRIVGFLNTGRVAKSRNGVDWTFHDFESTSRRAYTLFVKNGHFIGGGENNRFFYSDDGFNYVVVPDFDFPSGHFFKLFEGQQALWALSLNDDGEIIRLPFIDLAIDPEFALSVETHGPDSVNVDADIENRGIEHTQAEQPFCVSIHLSSNMVWNDDDDIELATFAYTSPIAPADSAQIGDTYPLPANLNAATYHLGIRVDTDESILESNEANNLVWSDAFDYTPKYELALQTVGNGNVERASEPSAGSGEIIELTAIADAGNVFAGWSGDIEGNTNPLTLTLLTDMELTAHFKAFSPIWRERHFTEAERGSGFAEAWADPDGDGITNFEEYLFGLNPKTADRNALPHEGTLVDEAVQKKYFTFTYRRTIGVSSLEYIVETSTDLGTWTPNPPNFEEAGAPVNNGDGTETVTLKMMEPIDEASFNFIRLRVVEE